MQLLQRFREATRPLHGAIEADFQPRQHLGSLADYRRMLVRFWGIHQPLEESIAPFADQWPLDWEKTRRRVPQLRADLLQLGLSTADLEAIDRCRAVPRANSPAGVLGALYVAEGSRLGAVLVGGAVVERLGLTPERGAAFLCGAGSETGQLWRSFVAVVQSADLTREEADEAVDIAAGTFRAFHEWLRASATGSTTNA
ncbi:MAG TPA: biliverdin-producing heme oxygenase [Chthoniobacteraceae bacterium]